MSSSNLNGLFVRVRLPAETGICTVEFPESVFDRPVVLARLDRIQ
ncbi:MAG: hypothetical protein VB858_18665 [Planctomycetaceae bacterium]